MGTSKQCTLNGVQRISQITREHVSSKKTFCYSGNADESNQQIPLGVEIAYACASNLGHQLEGHPESNERVPAILSVMEGIRNENEEFRNKVFELQEFNLATKDDLKLVHTDSYIEGIHKILEAQSKSKDFVEVIESAPTYVTGTSLTDVKRSAGAAMALVDIVVKSTSNKQQQQQNYPKIGFGLIRPPGHHALPQGPMGFCIFNPIAIAARHAQIRHGLKKIAIFDFDIHHGNGTHDMFYDDDSVLFISTHQQGSYPNTGKVTEVGKGKGEGYSINIPLKGDSGDWASLHTFEAVVQPALQRFKPDLILVSAGYDAHWRDPLAGLQFRTSTYHKLCGYIKEVAMKLCEGRVVFLLEGGYDLKGLGEGVADSFMGLLGLDSIDKFNPELLREEPRDKVLQLLTEVKAIHSI
eukprot:TRINITY_DN3592_c0_g1_i4.p1 TRINITY_DN3592_c0_g1~~TRINITY_DN3592_c0_g1_i4.p1  ORF type:complete len:454 (-),score=62.57 TRINITY_DN3592_c0_g1_i4:650-1882(-)